MRHIIATRLGLGVSRPAFYAKQLSLLYTTILPSLVAQTSTNFEWAVCVDARIDAGSLERLHRMLAAYPHFRVVKCDPIETLKLYPTLTDLLSDHDGEPVLLSRVDADDALGVRFVEIMREKAETFDGLAAFAFQRGAEIILSQGTVGPVLHKSIAIGVSLLSDGQNRQNIYGKNHTTIGDWVTEQGGTFVAIDEPGCHYLHVRRDDSDSHLHRKMRHVSTAPSPAREADGCFAAYYLEVCSAVGIAPSALDTLRAITPEELPQLPFPGTPRLASKQRLLQIIGEAREAGADGRTMQAYVNALYAL